MIASSSPTESGARVRASEREQMRVNRACPSCVRYAYGVSGEIFFRFARRARWHVRIELRSSKRSHILYVLMKANRIDSAGTSARAGVADATATACARGSGQ